jgi:hypothetical protein
MRKEIVQIPTLNSLTSTKFKNSNFDTFSPAIFICAKNIAIVSTRISVLKDRNSPKPAKELNLPLDNHHHHHLREKHVGVGDDDDDDDAEPTMDED